MEKLIKFKKINNSKTNIDLKNFEIKKVIKKKHKMTALVNSLRIIAMDKHLKKQTVLIPNNCEKHGFVEGYHNIGQLLYFLADMLEE
jgi:hypothetical protein